VTFYAKTTESFSRVVFTFGCATSVLTLAGVRIAVLQFVRRRIGPSLHNVMVLYAGGPSVEMKYAFHIDAKEHGLSPDIGDPANLDRVGCYMQNMDRVIVSCGQDERELWSPLLKMAGVQGEFISDALRKLGALRVTNEGEFSTIVVSAKPLGMEARLTKRAMDIVLSGAALLALSPLMLVVALLIKIEDGGPVLFRQRRMGEGNRFFSIYKFRSMRADKSDADANRLTSRNDDRTTRVGRFIRRTSIDELPQLYNVWRGDMSLVGPRPHALGALAGDRLYWEVDGRYWSRHVLKPGLTGLAQVRGFRGSTEEEGDLKDRLQADLEYISRWSLWLDLQIIIKTAFVIFHKNAY
jgi:exopolysaccharide biosynthesis polyprenyl glycosylphosphotransferase